MLMLKFVHLQGVGGLLILFLCLVQLSATGPVWASAAQRDPQSHILLGIAPFMSPLALARRMAPLRDYLARSLKQPVIIETSTDATEFVQRSLSGRYDILLTNPPFALAALEEGHYHLLVTQKGSMVGEVVRSGVARAISFGSCSLGQAGRSNWLTDDDSNLGMASTRSEVVGITREVTTPTSSASISWASVAVYACTDVTEPISHCSASM